MMSTWRRTPEVRPRRRSSQRSGRPTRNCCGEKICARIGKLLKISQNQKSSDLPSFETVFNKFLVKFSQCRPQLQTVKSRLRESCELLSEIDELLEFFCDPQRLWAYVLEEQPQSQPEAANSSPKHRIEPASEIVAPLGRDVSKSDSLTSFRSKIPGVETIIEETEESPPPRAAPVRATLNEGVDENESRRRTGSQKRSLQMQTPDCPLFSTFGGDRTDSPNTIILNRLAKRFKTSTPAENGALLDVSPPRISLIPHQQVQCGRRRRKAMIIEPPSEDGAWMGTPVIRNQPDSQTPQKNNLDRRKSISRNSVEDEQRIAATINEDQQVVRLAPVMPLQAAGKDAVAPDEGDVDKGKQTASTDEPVQPKLGSSPTRMVTRGQNKVRGGPLVEKLPMTKAAEVPGRTDRKNGRGIVDVAPPPRAAGELFPPKRPRRNAVKKRK